MGERVLVVEDNRDIALLFSLLLDPFDVTKAGTVAEARAAEGAFACIVAGQHLPDGRGLDLLDMGPPVVVVTADARLETRTAALKAGAVAFLLKPTDLPRLSQVVADAIKGD